MTTSKTAARLFGQFCQECSKMFYPTNKRGPKPKFCSKACKQKAYRRSVKLAEIEAIKRKLDYKKVR